VYKEECEPAQDHG